MLRRELEDVVRLCLNMDADVPVTHRDVVAALVAGLPARQRARALKRRGEEVQAPPPPYEPQAVQETGHMWHGRKVALTSMNAQMVLPHVMVVLRTILKFARS